MATEKKEIRKGPKIVGKIILAMVAIATVCVGSYWFVNSLAYVNTDDASIDCRQMKISSRILGRIGSVAVSEGERVSSGDTLITLDATDLRAQESQANASLAYARQNLALAKINLDRTIEDSDRIGNLFANGAATREANEHAKNAQEVSLAQYALAQAQIDTSAAQVGVIHAQLLNAELSAPIPGTVDKITLVAGDVAQPGQTIMTINDLDDVWIIANLEETKINRIAVGGAVKIHIDAYPDRDFVGAVETMRAGIVAPAFQIGEFTKTTQRIPVKIRLSDSAAGIKLLPGMSVEVKVRTTARLPSFLDR